MKITVTEHYVADCHYELLTLSAETECGKSEFYRSETTDKDQDFGEKDETECKEFASFAEFLAAGYDGEIGKVIELLDAEERAALKAKRNEEKRAALKARKKACRCSDGTKWVYARKMWREVDDDTFFLYENDKL